MKRIALSIVGALLIQSAFAAETTRTYQDKEAGFSFSYPSTWREQPGLGRNTRVVITSPQSKSAPDGHCNVVVRTAPITSGKTQDQINKELGGREFEKAYWLRDMPANTRVFDSRTVSLGTHTARTAVLDYAMTIQGNTLYTTQLHLITLSPGTYFGMVCGATEDTPEEARAAFTYWKATFQRIVESMRVTAERGR